MTTNEQVACEIGASLRRLFTDEEVAQMKRELEEEDEAEDSRGR